MRGCVNFCCGRRTTDDGRETRGVLRGPRGPKKQKQEEGDGIKETDKKADLFVLWKYEINLWLVRSSNKF